MRAPTDAGVGPADATTRDGSVSIEAGPLPDASRVQRDDDGNAGFEDAINVAIGGDATTGTIASVRDVDYLRFEATAGQWIAVLWPELPKPFSENDQPSITVLNADMRPILTLARETGCAGVADHREMDFRVPAAGTYYVEVSASVAARSGTEFPSNAWSVRVVDLATSSASLIVTESSSARVTSAHRCVLGVFETLGDEDTVALELPAYTTLFVRPPETIGSTAEVRELEILDADGEVVARAAQQPPVGPRNPVGAGVPPHSLTVLVDDAAALSVRLSGPAVLGANDFYIMWSLGYIVWPRDWMARGVHFVESEDATNDAFATPESMPALPVVVEDRFVPFVMHVDAGDVDHFEFDTGTTSVRQLYCSGRAFGSSVLDVQLQLLDAAGTTISNSREDSFGPALMNVSIEPGRHVIRISAMTFESGLSSTGVVCVFSL